MPVNSRTPLFAETSAMSGWAMRDVCAASALLFTGSIRVACLPLAYISRSGIDKECQIHWLLANSRAHLKRGRVLRSVWSDRCLEGFLVSNFLSIRNWHGFWSFIISSGENWLSFGRSMLQKEAYNFFGAFGFEGPSFPYLGGLLAMVGSDKAVLAVFAGEIVWGSIGESASISSVAFSAALGSIIGICIENITVDGDGLGLQTLFGLTFWNLLSSCWEITDGKLVLRHHLRSH